MNGKRVGYYSAGRTYSYATRTHAECMLYNTAIKQVGSGRILGERQREAIPHPSKLGNLVKYIFGTKEGNCLQCAQFARSLSWWAMSDIDLSLLDGPYVPITIRQKIHGREII